MYIANPIYDSVFKYLVEDNRIARTLISALLQKEVVEVEMRPHEYANSQHGQVSMFRIDFAAKVRQDDGSTRLVLIELQKTWVETETLRFRQYLGAQYSNPSNMERPEPPHGDGLPLVAVYLLGHRVGEIDEPVLYVNHRVCDYYGKVITKGMPDPFVESLVHSSIIVQIPLLKGRLGNRLEKILSVFDQSRKYEADRHVLSLDETLYGDDEEMHRILFRLQSAAASPDMRQDMNVEDEYFSALESRETAIMKRDLKIAEQDETISKLDETISKRNETISRQGEMINKQGETISKQGETISKQGETISKQGETISKQGETISKQGETISKMAKVLQASGVPLEDIARMVGKSIGETEALLR